MLQQRTIELPVLDFRASLGTVNDEARTVEVTFSTGAAWPRYDYRNGERYMEVLSLDPKHVRLARLNAGAPVLDTHNGYSVRQMLGAVVDGSAAIVGKADARALLRFSRRPDVAGVWQDVVDKICRAVSMGYAVHKYEETRVAGRLPVRTATDWEPFEVSMVPMPIDVGGRTRSVDATQVHPCVIVTRITDADRRRQLELANART